MLGGYHQTKDVRRRVSALARRSLCLSFGSCDPRTPRGSPKTDCKRRSERSSPAGPIHAAHGDHVAAVLAGSDETADTAQGYREKGAGGFGEGAALPTPE